MQVFARKILRLFWGVCRKDIDNEAHAVSQLCAAGKCKNIVEVIRHGWMANNPLYYFIDMEYCPETLNDRILGIVRETESDSESRSMKDFIENTESRSAEPKAPEPVDAKADVNPPLENTETILDPDLPESDFQHCLDIIIDIVNALIYIHESGMVHRDLKPQNGIYLILYV